MRLETVDGGCTGLMAFLGDVNWDVGCCEDKLCVCVMCVPCVGLVFNAEGVVGYGEGQGSGERSSGGILVVRCWD